MPDQKTITLCNWKAKNTKRDLYNATEWWFLKDIKTNKYWGVIMEPSHLDKKQIDHSFSGRWGSNFCGHPIFYEDFKDNGSIFSDAQKKLKFKRKFKLVSIPEYIKDVNKHKEKPCPTKKQ